MQKKEDLIVILGPTATGKTELSINLAREFDGEIISADSMQIYQGMNIGTATPRAEARREVPHHLINIITPDQYFSVVDFQKRAQRLISEINSRNRIPLLVGGTGLYIKATVHGFIFPEMDTDWAYRKQCEELAEKKGNLYLHSRLQEIDPETADRLHPNDQRRIIRALEVYRATGKTVSYYKQKARERPDPYHHLKIGLTASREEIYDRINKRVDRMLKQGLLEEVKDLITAGYSPELPALQGLGYKELIGYLEGEYDYQEAVRLIKRNTRHFAKKQLTWFKKEKDVHWFRVDKAKKKDLRQQAGDLITSFLSQRASP